MLSAIKHGLQHFDKSGFFALGSEAERGEAYYFALSDGKTTWYLGNNEHWMTVYKESMLLTWNQSEHLGLNDHRHILVQGVVLQAGHIARVFDMKAVCLNLVQLDTNVIVNSVWIEEYITKRAQMVPISMAMNLPSVFQDPRYAIGQQPSVEATAKGTWDIPTVKEFRKRHGMDVVTYQEVMNGVEALFDDPKMWDQKQISGARYFWTIDFPGIIDQGLMDLVKLELTSRGWEVLWGCCNGNWDISLYVNKD